MIVPTSDQKQAVEAVKNWLKTFSKPFFTVGGFAGTGKTALAALVRRELFLAAPDVPVAFCAFTGKAVQVLRQVLTDSQGLYDNDTLSTIHSLIYERLVDTHGQVVGWRKKPNLETGLIITDEASMISGSLWQDLVSYRIPVLAIGDHGQLPPIGEEHPLMQTPDLVLHQIHRQAENSPIIRLSMMARTEGRIPVGRFSQKVRKYHRQDSDIASITQELLESWNEETLFLVGTNRTRMKLNRELRLVRGIEEEKPSHGDRVICLKNNWRAGIFNGMTGAVEKISPVRNGQGEVHWYDAEIMMDDGTFYEGRISAHQFNQPQNVSSVEGLHYKEIGDLFDFGYAVTVHKAQGSQARKAVVFEERNRHMDEQDWKRWLYTAVTRAQEELVIVGD